LEQWTAAPLPARIALAALAVALSVSVATDLKSRRILNAVTYPALVVVAGCAIWLGGFPLLLQSALGALACATPLLFAMWRGWMGAGDMKLMAVAGLVAGAAAGWPLAVTVLLQVAIAGGLQALLWAAVARVRGRERPKTIPYALAIAAGTIPAFVPGLAHIS